MQKKKNGFTLVELLVVIAILAILAAVSVVGYLSFTEKAKESNDNTLVTQLNTVLQADEASDGKPKTMSDALAVLKENGFLVENLTPTSAKNEFLYNLKENRFEIKTQDEVKNLNNGDYWYIVEDEASLNDMKDNCSIYLIDGLSLTNTEILDIKYGFDSLNNSVTKLTIKNEDVASNIVLNTNAANIEINATDDNVSHYGTAENVTVTAVANNSYHEYGIVNRVEVTSGHIEFMPNSKVNEIYVTSNNANITITDKVQDYDKINIVLSSGVVLPEGSITKPEGSNEVITEILVKRLEDISNVVKTNGTFSKTSNSKYFKLANDIEWNTSVKFSGCFYKPDNIRYIINLNNYKIVSQDSLNQGFIKLIHYNPLLVFKNGTLNFSAQKNGSPIILTEGRLNIDNCQLLYDVPVAYSETNQRPTMGFIEVEEGTDTVEINLNRSKFIGTNLLLGTKNTKTYINDGVYTYRPAKNDQGVVVDSNSPMLLNFGKMIISGAHFKIETLHQKKHTIYNKASANIIINDAIVESVHGSALYNEGIAKINGGKYISKSCYQCSSETIIKFGYVYSVYSGGNNNTFITINEGTYIEGIHGGLAVTSGGAEINGGNIVTVECPTHKTTSHYALYLAGEVAETNIIINGGEFTSFDKVAMYVGNSNDGGNKEHARVTVKGGAFNGGGDKTAIKVDSSLGYLNVLGGKYSSDISKVANLTVNTVQNGNYWVVA